MKFHESLFEEYVTAMQKLNLHPELANLPFPDKVSDFGNLIIHGPPGVGKYSQMLRVVQRYSPSELKYDKRMTLTSEKHLYTYRISDIHYEVDMALLGCNSIVIWHEVFTQIVDIVSLKHEKCAIIVCKNFHAVHTELLGIFYTYMQQYNHPHLAIQLKFILLTEHVGFLPHCILDHCRRIAVKRPEKGLYAEMFRHIIEEQVRRGMVDTEEEERRMMGRIDAIEPCQILNLKELHWFTSDKPMPAELFNIVCDAILQDMMSPDTLRIADFRDKVYDIFVFHLDPVECVWYILSQLVEKKRLQGAALRKVLDQTYPFLKQFNNNYRSIYHVESILFFMMTQQDINGNQQEGGGNESSVGLRNIRVG